MMSQSKSYSRTVLIPLWLWFLFSLFDQVISGKHGQFYARNRFNHYDKKVMSVIKLKMSLAENWLHHLAFFKESASLYRLVSFSVPEEVVLCAQLRAAHAEGERSPNNPRQLDLPWYWLKVKWNSQRFLLPFKWSLSSILLAILS